MKTNNLGTEKYKIANEITATRKTKQVVMLYDGIIKFLSETKQGIIENDPQKRFNSSERAAKIIDGLFNCLDYEKGGEIAKILESFYSGIFTRVMHLNFEKDKEKNIKNCTQIIDEVRIMRDAWDEVDQKHQNNIPSPQNQENIIKEMQEALKGSSGISA